MSDFFQTGHFETGEYARNSTFLEDEEYSRALDTFVKGCADVLLIDRTTDQVLVLKRKVHPQPEWWFLGGRMKAGDTPQESAQKNVKRETGILFELGRFRTVCHASYLWQWRKQQPASNGTADIAVVFSVDVSPEERAAVKDVDPEEYECMRWTPLEEVLRLSNCTGGFEYHPALRRAIMHLKLRDAFQELQEAVTSKGDSEVASIARQICQMQTESFAKNLQ